MHSGYIVLCVWIFLTIPTIRAQTGCSRGYYATSTTANCAPCAAGQYADVVGMSVCKACIAGTYSTSGSSTCKNCPVDTINTLAQQSYCTVCPLGYHAKAGSTVCSTCPAGTTYNYATATTASSCTSCPINSYSVMGGLQCLACSSGSYTTGGASACITCTPGTYLNGQACTNCAASTYSSHTGATTCTSCEPGRYSLTGSSFCSYCLAGSYSDSESGLCLQCSPGTYTATYGQTVCTLCNADTYTTKVGGTSCTNCALGTFSLMGSSSCSTCNGWVTCQGYPYMSKCTSCPSGQFIAFNPISFCSNNNERTAAFQYCQPCRTTCAPGNYLNYQCTGTQTKINTCLPCDTGTCDDISKYRATCTTTQNSACSLTKTQCNTGEYLLGHSSFQDGVCTPCDICGTYLQQCTNYQNAICQTQCGVGNPCVQSPQVCIYKNNFDLASNACFLCPPGFKRVDKICIPCPRGAVCDGLGDIKRWLRCAVGWYPSSSGTCVQCTNFQVTNLIAGNSEATYPAVENSCTPFYRCNTGYYRTYANTNPQLHCQVCVPVVSKTIISHGLQDNDPYSCLYEDTFIPTVTNAAGYYWNDNLKVQSKCPALYTSLENRASSVNDCRPCPSLPQAVNYDTNTPTCQWLCPSYYEQYGITCVYVDQLSICVDTPGLVYTNMRCNFRPIPWQRPGYSYKSSVIVRDRSIASTDINVKYIGLFDSKDPDIRVNRKSEYDMATANLIDSAQTGPYPFKTPGLICSATIDRDFLYVVFCNTTMIMYFNQATGDFRRLIGNNSRGNVDGFRDDARFENELYITNTTQDGRIIVMDTFNNRLSEVVVGPQGPGDYLTKSYRIATSISLSFPRFFFPLLMDRGELVAFLNDYNKVCQINTTNRLTACTSIALAEADMPVVSMSATDDKTELRIHLSTKTKTYINAGSPCSATDAQEPACFSHVCADDTTSLAGGDCTIQAPFNNGDFGGYYILDGVPIQCTPATCGVGEYPDKCTRNGPSTCTPCVKPTDISVVFYVLGTCDYKIVHPCPFHMYADNNDVCSTCPHLMYTRQMGSRGKDSCLCEYPLVKQGDLCVLPAGESLFPMFQPNDCPFTQYKPAGSMTCSYCVDEPCILPNVGQYAETCYGPLKTCTIPANSYATSTGLLAQPNSCTWACNPGYQKNAAQTACVACTNKPGTNTETYYYDGCLWDYYI